MHSTPFPPIGVSAYDQRYRCVCRACIIARPSLLLVYCYTIKEYRCICRGCNGSAFHIGNTDACLAIRPVSTHQRPAARPRSRLRDDLPQAATDVEEAVVASQAAYSKDEVGSPFADRAVPIHTAGRTHPFA